MCRSCRSCCENVALDPQRMQQDGIHPNARGEPPVLETIWPQLSPLLKKYTHAQGIVMDRIWLKSYPPHVPAEIDPSQLGSLKELLEQACAHYPERVAFVQMGTELTFGRLDEHTRAFAAWLQHAGLRKGDRIAIMLPNTLQYPIAMFGALRAGLIVVNTNPLYTAPELEHQLSDSGAMAIVVLENFAHVVQQVLPSTPASSACW